MRGAIRRLLGSQEMGLLLVVVVVCVVLAVLAGSHVDRRTGEVVNSFWNSFTLVQVATDSSFFAIMAIGATVVIISGGIDLSVGSTYALAGVVMALLLRTLGPMSAAPTVFVALVTCLGVGLLCGLVNGALIVGLRVNPFIITLGTMWMLRGIAFVISRAESILVPSSVTAVAKSSLGLGGGLYPVPMLVMLAVTATGVVYLTRTVMGRHVFAFGGNLEASRFAGLPLQAHPGWCLRRLRARGGTGGIPGREFLRISVVGGRPGLRAVRDCLCRGGWREPERREGECVGRAAWRTAHRVDSAVDPYAPPRPELRVDHHRWRHYHRGRH